MYHIITLTFLTSSFFNVLILCNTRIQQYTYIMAKLLYSIIYFIIHLIIEVT